MRSRKALALWALAVGYAATIFLLSAFPVPAPAEAAVRVGDKALHLLEYAGFALLLSLAIASAPAPRVRLLAPWIALAGAVLYAASDELHQAFVPGRDASFLDLAADVAGAAIGAAVHGVWAWRERRAAVSGTSPP